jgi:adenylosuccinate synthase
MAVDVLLGLQWGDEGKGKIVDVITSRYDIIARFQGGPNAGHTLVFDGIKHVTHTIPSGIFNESCLNIVGNGVVIDPVIFKREMDELAQFDLDLPTRLVISKKAHLILPTHRLLDAASEKAKGKAKIGSTLKGIAPTYMDKTGRNGLRVGDLVEKNFREKYDTLVKKHAQILKYYNYEYDLEPQETEWFEAIEALTSLDLIDSEYMVNQALKEGKSILAEGAQGTLLDIDFGSYPFVTSSNTISAGACTGLGIAPNTIGEVIGVFKAYCTRVGSGPFPTEQINEAGERMQKAGHEFGATTGRPRRCGWIDIPALKYTVMINGVTQLIMTKADVLTGFEIIKICTHYLYRGEEIDSLPYQINEDLKPVYKEMKGWDENLTGLRSIDDIPKELEEYITYLENELHVPIVMVSVGPDRKETLHRKAATVA